MDAATLTGAVVVALGHVNVGAFTNNQAFLDKLLAAAKTEGEKMWQLPHGRRIQKSCWRASSPICTTSAAARAEPSPPPWFIAISSNETPWVHLDIAGTAWLDDGKPYMAKGATGMGVRTFVQLAETW